MIPSIDKLAGKTDEMPRTCGDDPITLKRCFLQLQNAPHLRG